MRFPGKPASNEKGFNLIELMVAMAAFLLVIISATNVFVPMIGQSKQQSKIAETHLEGVVGLELLRSDIAQAGIGLPWTVDQDHVSDSSGNGSIGFEDLGGGAGYSEAVSDTTGVPYAPDPKIFNDGNPSPSGASAPPRAILSGNDSGLNGSDYLVIKSTAVAANQASQRWTYISNGSTQPFDWNDADEKLTDDSYVIVMRPVKTSSIFRELIVDSTGKYYTTFSSASFPAEFIPPSPGETFLIFGINNGTSVTPPASTPRMPFNRADYYISTANVPARCAKNSGVLVKSVLDHADGKRDPALPILDCVVDFQVVYKLDGTPLVPSDDISTLSAADIRSKLKQVQVSILTHEGARDMSYTYSGNPNITVGGDTGLPGHTFSLQALVGADWDHYRWKIYKIVVDMNEGNLGW